jgi:hypothetical protein
MLEKTLKQDQRVGRHVGVEERSVPVNPGARWCGLPEGPPRAPPA